MFKFTQLSCELFDKNDKNLPDVIALEKEIESTQKEMLFAELTSFVDGIFVKKLRESNEFLQEQVLAGKLRNESYQNIIENYFQMEDRIRKVFPLSLQIILTFQNSFFSDYFHLNLQARSKEDSIKLKKNINETETFYSNIDIVKERERLFNEIIEKSKQFELKKEKYDENSRSLEIYFDEVKNQMNKTIVDLVKHLKVEKELSDIRTETKKMKDICLVKVNELKNLQNNTISSDEEDEMSLIKGLPIILDCEKFKNSILEEILQCSKKYHNLNELKDNQDIVFKAPKKVEFRKVKEISTSKHTEKIENNTVIGNKDKKPKSSSPPGETKIKILENVRVPTKAKVSLSPGCKSKRKVTENAIIERSEKSECNTNLMQNSKLIENIHKGEIEYGKNLIKTSSELIEESGFRSPLHPIKNENTSQLNYKSGEKSLINLKRKSVSIESTKQIKTPKVSVTIEHNKKHSPKANDNFTEFLPVAVVNKKPKNQTEIETGKSLVSETLANTELNTKIAQDTIKMPLKEKEIIESTSKLFKTAKRQDKTENNDCKVAPNSKSSHQGLKENFDFNLVDMNKEIDARSTNSSNFGFGFNFNFDDDKENQSEKNNSMDVCDFFNFERNSDNGSCGNDRNGFNFDSMGSPNSRKQSNFDDFKF